MGYQEDFQVRQAPKKLEQAKAIFGRLKTKPGKDLVQPQLQAIEELFANFNPVFKWEYDHALTLALTETLAGETGVLLQPQNFPAFMKDFYALINLLVGIHPCLDNDGDAVIDAVNEKLDEIRTILLANAKPYVFPQGN